MIPDRFQFRQSLPKTSTDKIDYQALQGGIVNLDLTRRAEAPPGRDHRASPARS